MVADKEIDDSSVSEVLDSLNRDTKREVNLVVRNQSESVFGSYVPKTTPFEHQIEGVLYGINHHRFILGDQPGLGKTKQIIDLSMMIKSPGKKVLIICGVNGLKYNWVDEVDVHSFESGYILGQRIVKGKKKIGSTKDKLYDIEHLSEIPDYFIITNMETLRLNGKKVGKRWVYPLAEALAKHCNSGLISLIAFDECHKAKNPNSHIGRALLKLDADYLVAMSGTPQLNSPLDMYMPLHWLGYESHSYYSFTQYYCRMGGFGGKEIMGYRHLPELRKLVDSVMLRRLKKDVLDLPDKLESYEYVEMTPAQTKIYNEVKTHMLKDVDLIYRSLNPIAEFIRLRQATGYTGLLSSIVKESAKLDRMVELVEDCVSNNSKCIIFSNWEAMVYAAVGYLGSYEPAVITGSVNDGTRMDEVNRFQTDPNCKVILGTIGALGTGFTITAANTVIFLDEPWNAAYKEQAEDRAYRIGTSGTVNVITLICKDTVDERVSDIVRGKAKVTDFVIDGKPMNNKSLVDFLLS